MGLVLFYDRIVNKGFLTVKGQIGFLHEKSIFIDLSLGIRTINPNFSWLEGAKVMARRIEYYVCLISPWTYLGDGRFTAIAERHGAEVDIKPMNLGRVFPETGGLPLAKRAPARQAYRMQELARWRDFLGVPLNFEPKFFPADEAPAAAMVIAAKRHGLDCAPLVNGYLTAVWAEDRNIADPDTIVAVADERGFDGKALFEASRDPAMIDTWDAYSRDALAAGVFGAPAYVIGEQLFWGQDRLDFVERALAAS
jgi:2-hydroxychromene-2-carboxylate isomerase